SAGKMGARRSIAGLAVLLLSLTSCGSDGAASPSTSAQTSTSIRAISGGTSTPVPTTGVPVTPTAAPTATAPAPTAGPTATAVPTAAPEPIKIGLAASLSGPAALFGRDALKAAETAVDEANARGGVLGRTLTIDQGDDRTDTEGAAAAARKLAAD